MATIAEILAKSLGPPRPPPPNYMPNFDAANPDPTEPLQLKPLGRGYVLPDYTQHEQDQNAVEAAASRYRIANQQPDPENRGVAHDLALAAGAPPLIADAAGMLAPRPPKTPLDLATMGMGAGTFLGIGSRTADKAAYKLANEMEAAGRHPEVIRQTTGWQRAADGNWKYEISDANAKLTGVKSGSLEDVFSHPELYAAEPRLAETRATIGQPGGSYYQPGGNGAIKTLPVINISKTSPDPLGSMIHEVQHDVQDRSGFAPGANNFAANLKPGNPAWDIYQEKLKTAGQKTLSFLLHGKVKPISPSYDAQIREEALLEAYRRSVGENEANAAAARRAMRQEDLKKIPPQAFEAYPRDQQIVQPPRVPGNKAPEPQFQIEDPKFVGPPPETDRARLTSFYNTAADQMALDPKDRFQPDPSHQVIDTNYQTPPPFVGPPQDLSQLYARHPDPAAALPTKDRARFFTDPVRKEAIAQKLVEKIQASGVMNSDARYFYGSAGPLFRAARKAGLTINDAMAWIRDFGSITGATSPRTEVVPNVRNATSVMAKEAAGIPHREILGPGTTNAKTGEPGISERGYPMMTGEGGLHGQLIDDVLSGRGINPLTNTKPAVFEKQVGQGNLSGVTADTHIVRGAVMTANELYPGQIPIDWIKAEHRAAYRANPSRMTPDMVNDTLGSQMVDGQKMQTEFPVIADLYHRAAQILKVDPAEAQAMGWFGMGGQTNLGSQLETVAKVLNDRISVTAQALGKTPEWVAEQVFRRRIPVMSLLGGTAAGAAAVGAAGQPPQPPGGT